MENDGIMEMSEKKTVCYVMKCGNKLVLQWMMQRMGYELDS